MQGSRRESEFSPQDSTNGCWEPNTEAGTGKRDWTSAPLSDGKPSHFHPETGAQILTTSTRDEVLSLLQGTAQCTVVGVGVWGEGMGRVGEVYLDLEEVLRGKVCPGNP